MAPEVLVRDVLVSAQTGSGKTVAFGLALARTLLGDTERFTAAGAPRALIVTPTRELAMQVHRELSWLFAETGARITTCVGGMDPRRESHALSHGVHVVVGTPGRLCDHLARGSLVLDRLAAIVLDEADEMLDMGFREDLERLLDAAPADRRTLMFSATIPKPIATLAKRYQRDAMRIATSGEGDRHRDIEYQVVSVVPRERDLAVVNLLRFHDAPGALVFCGTRDGVTHLAANLSERGFAVAALSGELSQRERNQALQALRDGRARVCVATDVAARGLDLPDLGLVIHADLPQNKEMLVHRSGRTGRAGKKGLAIVIAVDAARRFVERLLGSARVEATWSLAPSSDDIRARDQEHLVGEVQALTDEISDADRAVARTLLAERSAEDLVAGLVRLRRDARPAPEELTIPMSMRPRPGGDRRPPPGHERAERADRSDRPRYDHAVRVPHRGPDDRSHRGDSPSRGGHAEPRAHADAGHRAERPRFGAGRHDDRPASVPRTEPADRPVRARADRADRADRAERMDAAPRTTAQPRVDVRPTADRTDGSPGVERVDVAVPGPGVPPRGPAQADVVARADVLPGPDWRPTAELAHGSPGGDAPCSSDGPTLLDLLDLPLVASSSDVAYRAARARAPSPGSGVPVPRSERPEATARGDADTLSASRPERPAHAERPEPAPRGDATPAVQAEGPAHTERPEPAARDDADTSSASRPARAERPAHPERRGRPVAADRAEYGHHARPERAAHRGPDARDEARKLVWFTINIGRSKNADPKWLIPLLCRRGGISKNAIGKIQILARETRVEISHDVSERFAAAVREPDTKDRNIHIEPLDAIAL